jgi:phosphate transport system ATP-binding protein
VLALVRHVAQQQLQSLRAQARRIANYAAFFWMKERVGRLIEFGHCRSLFDAPAHPLTAAYVSGLSG